MEPKEEIGQLLHLTEGEVEIYRIILMKKNITASDIYRITSIQRPKLYSILKSLEEKGIIKVRGNKPRVYSPVDPVKVLKKEKTNTLNAFERVGDYLLRLYSDEGDYAGVRELRDMDERIHFIISGIKYSMNMVISTVWIEPYRLLKLLKKRNDLQITVYLYEKIKDEYSSFFTGAGFEVFPSPFKMDFMVVDNEDTYIFLKDRWYMIKSPEFSSFLIFGLKATERIS